MAFERIEPFGGLHDEQMAGTIAATTVNLHRKEGTDPISARDFFPALDAALGGDEPAVAETPEEQADLLVKMLQGIGRG